MHSFPIRFCVIILLLSYNINSYSQTKIAKIKYEDAESAYQDGDFQKALVNLNDAEKLFGKTNVPISYLRIILLDTIISKDPYKEFEPISILKKETARFLKEYEKVVNIEDRYKAVYYISEKIKQYPNTQKEFLNLIDSLEQDKKSRIERFLTKCSAFEYSDIKLGMSKDETLDLYPKYKKYIRYEKDKRINIDYDYSIMSKKEKYNNTVNNPPIYLLIKGNTIIGYKVEFLNIPFDAAVQKLNQLENQISIYAMKNPTKPKRRQISEVVFPCNNKRIILFLSDVYVTSLIITVAINQKE